MEKKKKKINFWKNGGLGKINKENHGKIEYDYGEDISWFPEEDDEDEVIDPFLDPENSVIQGPNEKILYQFINNIIRFIFIMDHGQDPCYENNI